MSGDGFSDTGMIVFFVTMLVMSGGLMVATCTTALFARRHRLLKALGVFLGGGILGVPVLIVATAVAMYI
ncbi:hypothetical protein ACTXJ1_16850 [Brachybacterium alimentarium]|uniref:hypothetical protein n=1 Tax=Brachybacterium alimentarium TaxID=47845 RepID=UPI003FD07CD8